MIQNTRQEQSRLALLYILERAQMPLTESQLARIVSETSAMNYFDFRTALPELGEGSLIEALPMLGGLAYEISSQGTEMIDSLRTDLRYSIRRAVDEYLLENREALENESTYRASFAEIGEGQYRAQAQIVSDGLPVFQLSMILGSRAEAATFTENWKKKGAEIYQRLLVDLTV